VTKRRTVTRADRRISCDGRNQRWLRCATIVAGPSEPIAADYARLATALKRTCGCTQIVRF
jgi:translation initiation factor 1 (eIF-1/SUI1)